MLHVRERRASVLLIKSDRSLSVALLFFTDRWSTLFSVSLLLPRNKCNIMKKVKLDIEFKYDKMKPRLAAVVYKLVLRKGKKELVIKYSTKE